MVFSLAFLHILLLEQAWHVVCLSQLDLLLLPAILFGWVLQDLGEPFGSAAQGDAL